MDAGYPPEELETRQALNEEILALAGAVAPSEFAELHVACIWEAVGESFLRGAFMNTPDDAVAAYVEQARQRNAARLDALSKP